AASVEDEWSLTLSGDSGTALHEGNPGQGELRLTLDRDDQAPLSEDVVSDSGRWLLDAFLASAGQSPMPRSGVIQDPDAARGTSLWGELARDVELVEAVERSVRRRRTIDIYFEAPSERGIFKTQMTAVGCSLLVLTFAAVVTYLALAATVEMAPALKRGLVVLIFLPLGIFLALQLLFFV